MYGTVDAYIAQEIAGFVYLWSKDMMDPITVNRIAHIRQQEILEQAAQDRAAAPVLRPVRRQLGGLLVTLGQKLMRANGLAAQAAADDNRGYSSLENEACV